MIDWDNAFEVPVHHQLRPRPDGRGAKVFYKSRFIGELEYAEGSWCALAPGKPLRAFDLPGDALAHLRVTKLLEPKRGGSK